MTYIDKLKANKDVKDYFTSLLEKIDYTIAIAKTAKEKGKDISTDIETIPAAGIAEKTEILVGPKGVAKIYNDLWEIKKDRFEVTLDIFNMILDKQLGNIEDPEKRLEQAIRTALVIQTDGVVVSPLDGLPQIKISTNPDGSKYPDIYFAGPIRAAGGNAQTLPLLLADVARKKLHLDRYKPTEREIERIVEETMIYQTDVVARQQRVTEQEIRTIAQNCQICVNSGPDSDVEVVANRDIKRIPTNRIRGAMCLVLIDGLFVRAMKILKTSKRLEVDWSWLEKLIKVKKNEQGTFELKPSSKYIEGLAAGRPVFSHPSRTGGFRLRYGKARNTGLMAKAINPATMYVLDSFIAVGTHGKIERPGKSLQYFPCDTIDGPIVRLKNKSVIKIDTVKDAKENLEKIEKILFVGDILISVGDFKKSGHPLVKNGYVEEEWISEIKYLIRKEKLKENILEEINEFLTDPNPYSAINLSLTYNIPLYPKYIWYYDLLDNEELKILIEKIRFAEKIFEDQKIIGVKIKNNNVIKQILEKIGIPHKLEENFITLKKNESYPLLKTLGALNVKNPLEEFEDLFLENLKTVEKLSKISNLTIKEKSGIYIGARMGRPEAAHERLITGKPNVLFPIGIGYGNNRDIVKAARTKADNSKPGDYGINDVEIKAYVCPNCKTIVYNNYCFDCNCQAEEIRYCQTCNKQSSDKICPICNVEPKLKVDHKINLDRSLEKASKNLNVGIPKVLRGVKDLVSGDRVAEPLEKGILRAKHEVLVFRDGTIRYEALNATITQFTAKELNLSVEKIKELGYVNDYLGKKIKSEDQRISLFPQDIIVDEGAGDYFLKVSRFVDDLLEKFYGIDKFYNKQKKEDLIGELVIALAPHTSAGIVGRIIGFSKSKLAWGHPYFITAKRRNVDGDQDSMMLLMDALLNFSVSYLSKGRGGRMDAPLAFTTIVNPFEIDDECYEMETITEYPFEFYINAKNYKDADDKNLSYVDEILGTDDQYSCIKFTHDTNCFDQGPKQSAYLTIQSMTDKVEKQAKLQARILAVDNKDALERLLHYHLFPDIIGNTRAFARQKLRCVKCNAKYRRIPLSGICTCGGKLILTIHEGSIRKYINVAKDVIKRYELKPYLYQKIKLAEEDVDSLFMDKEERNQKNLAEFF